MNKRQKIRIRNRDKASCTYCTKIITKKIDMTIDHVFPRKLGGKGQMSNLTTCCQKCNTDKGSMLLTDYLRAFNIKVTPEIARFL